VGRARKRGELSIRPKMSGKEGPNERKEKKSEKYL